MISVSSHYLLSLCHSEIKDTTSARVRHISLRQVLTKSPPLLSSVGPSSPNHTNLPSILQTSVGLEPRGPRLDTHQLNNVYGDNQHLVEQVKEIECKSCWRDIVREPRPSYWLEPQMPGNLPGTPVAPPAHTPTSPTTSDSEDDIEQLCHEGGVDLAAFLMSKAISIQAVSAEIKPIREWTYRDILKLPAAAQEKWKATCRHKLDILCECKIYELVDLPKGHKVIGN